MSVLTVGEILVEVMAKEIGQRFDHPGELVGPFPSGAPAIFIDQVARMGVKAGIVARVGNDDFAKLNINRLQVDGVDISHILLTPDYATGTAFVTYFPDGNREFIYHFTNSAAGQLSAEDIKADIFADVEYLHIMGCSLTASRSMRQAIEKSINYCLENGIKISFDPNIRPELLDVGEIKNIFNKILEATDVLLTSKSELALLDDRETNKAIGALRYKGISIIVLKDGSRGAHVFSEEGEDYIEAIQVEEVDPTGAGDCFDGAFIASLVEGKSISQAARIANVAGALSVTKKGPMEGAAYKEEIMKYI